MAAFVSISICGDPNEVSKLIFAIASIHRTRSQTPTIHSPRYALEAPPTPQVPAPTTRQAITATPNQLLQHYQPFHAGPEPAPISPPRPADWTPILVSQFMNTLDERGHDVLRHLKSNLTTGSSHQAITLSTGLSQRQIAAVASYTSRKLRSFQRQHPNIILSRPFAINSRSKLYHIDQMFSQALL